MKILLIENEADLAAFWRKTLLAAGHSVLGIFSTGEEALEHVAGLDPDVVLVDILLDGALDGIETAARIRLLARAHIVFMTAHGEGDFLSSAIMAGPSGYIQKPFSATELLAAIEKCEPQDDDNDMTQATDHDLLVRLDTKLDLVAIQLNEARGVMSTKADASRVDKLERVVDGINTKVLLASGALCALEVGLRLFWK